MQKLSELREQLCINGRHLKTHPASPSLEWSTRTCVWGTVIFPSQSPTFILLFLRVLGGPAAPAVWFGAHHLSQIIHGLARTRICPPRAGLPLPARAALEQRGAAGPLHRCSADQSPGSVERFIRLILISLGCGSNQNRHSTNSADNLPLLLSIKLSVCNLQPGY